jgi:hypothetical protein
MTVIGALSSFRKRREMSPHNGLRVTKSDERELKRSVRARFPEAVLVHKAGRR